MASQFNFGRQLRFTGHEYRKKDYGAALRWGCSYENRFVSKMWHPSFNVQIISLLPLMCKVSTYFSTMNMLVMMMIRDP